MIAADDKVVLRWTTQATDTGKPLVTPLRTLGATGRRTVVSGVNLLRIAAGQIAEEWIYWDELGFLQQLGVLYAPAQAPA